ncbi:MAG: Bax inhibitor-1/YccA family protein [Oscillospiraceae bacterium]|nr:Bax inhibitor-1/YccA family protein [Oscillospiraceae bacterium]
MNQDRDLFGREGYGGQTREGVGAYTAKTFLWMFLGLLTTFGVAVAGYGSMATLYLLYYIPYSHIVLLVAELAVVFILSASIHKIAVPVARALFFLYAVLNGIVFSAYFLIFNAASMVLVFLATAIYFGALATYGYLTKTDLSRLRPILVGGLIFLIGFGLLSMLIPGLQAADRILCLVGIAIFLGFTAYDTQKIRQYYYAFAGDPAMAQKASIISALELYLDFVNLFLYLLRFLGRRKS